MQINSETIYMKMVSRAVSAFISYINTEFIVSALFSHGWSCKQVGMGALRGEYERPTLGST